MLDCNDDTVAYQNHYSSVRFFTFFATHGRLRRGSGGGSVPPPTFWCGKTLLSIDWAIPV